MAMAAPMINLFWKFHFFTDSIIVASVCHVGHNQGRDVVIISLVPNTYFSLKHAGIMIVSLFPKSNKRRPCLFKSSDPDFLIPYIGSLLFGFHMEGGSGPREEIRAEQESGWLPMLAGPMSEATRRLFLRAFPLQSH